MMQVPTQHFVMSQGSVVVLGSFNTTNLYPACPARPVGLLDRTGVECLPCGMRSLFLWGEAHSTGAKLIPPG